MDKKKKILVVDDNEINRELLTEILKYEYEIEYAVDGEAAVFMLNKRIDEFDLMLLDIVMPKMDGFDVLQYMNNHNWIKKLPVVLISVEYSPAHIDRAFELGAFDFVNRPFDVAVVKRRVKNAISSVRLAADESDLQFMSIDTDF